MNNFLLPAGKECGRLSGLYRLGGLSGSNSSPGISCRLCSFICIAENDGCAHAESMSNSLALRKNALRRRI